MIEATAADPAGRGRRRHARQHRPRRDVGRGPHRQRQRDLRRDARCRRSRGVDAFAGPISNEGDGVMTDQGRRWSTTGSAETYDRVRREYGGASTAPIRGRDPGPDPRSPSGEAEHRAHGRATLDHAGEDPATYQGAQEPRARPAPGRGRRDRPVGGHGLGGDRPGRCRARPHLRRQHGGRAGQAAGSCGARSPGRCHGGGRRFDQRRNAVGRGSPPRSSASSSSSTARHGPLRRRYARGGARPGPTAGATPRAAVHGPDRLRGPLLAHPRDGASPREAAGGHGDDGPDGGPDRGGRHPCPILSAGGTATWDWTAADPRITEIQAGSYVVMDVFHGAMVGDFGRTVSSSRPRSSAGDRTAWSSTPATSRSAHRHSRGSSATTSSTTGSTRSTASSSQTDRPPFAVGDAVELVPGYAPATVNWYDAFHVVEDDVVVDIWPVIPRGPGHHGLIAG